MLTCKEILEALQNQRPCAMAHFAHPQGQLCMSTHINIEVEYWCFYLGIRISNKLYEVLFHRCYRNFSLSTLSTLVEQLFVPNLAKQAT